MQHDQCLDRYFCNTVNPNLIFGLQQRLFGRELIKTPTILAAEDPIRFYEK
jgi:hypothetical protein